MSQSTAADLSIPNRALPLSREQRPPLTAEQVERFQTQGFVSLTLPQILRDEVDQTAKILHRLFDEERGASEGRYFETASQFPERGPSSPALLIPSVSVPALARFAYRERAFRIARQLLGPGTVFVGDMAIRKVPNGGGATPWHQDGAFRLPGYHLNELSIWIALEDVTVERGAMRYIPGSHRHGILPHQQTHDNANLECVSGFDATDAVDCPLPAGGMVVHHVCTVHGASANESPTMRLGYILTFTRPSGSRRPSTSHPWMASLRSAAHARRTSWLLRGGICIEAYRRLRHQWLLRRSASAVLAGIRHWLS